MIKLAYHTILGSGYQGFAVLCEGRGVKLEFMFGSPKVGCLRVGHKVQIWFVSVFVFFNFHSCWFTRSFACFSDTIICLASVSLSKDHLSEALRPRDMAFSQQFSTVLGAWRDLGLDVKWPVMCHNEATFITGCWWQSLAFSDISVGTKLSQCKNCQIVRIVTMKLLFSPVDYW